MKGGNTNLFYFYQRVPKKERDALSVIVKNPITGGSGNPEYRVIIGLTGSSDSKAPFLKNAR